MRKERSKKRAALFLFSVVLLIFVILIFINGRTTQQPSFIREGRKELAVVGEATAVYDSSSITHCVKDLLIEAQAENIRAKNIKGNVAWSRSMPGKAVRLANAGQNIIIVDLYKNINYLSLQGKLLWAYKTDFDITDIFTEDNGSFLVEYKGMTGSHAEVFTQKGIRIGNISVENAHVLSFSSGEGKFSISILDTSSEIIKSKIITYDLKGDILWAHNFDNMIISKLKYNKDNKLIAIGENNIYLYKNDGSLQDEATIEGKISNIAMSENIVTIALQNKGKQYIVCYDANLREQSRTEINTVPLGIFPHKNSFIVYCNDEFMVLTSKGDLTARFKSNIDICSVYMISDNQIYMVSNRRLQLLEYKK